MGNLRKARAKLRRIRVPVNSRDGRERLELYEDPWLADVAGVQDVVDLLEDVEDFGPQQAVRVGDHPDSHRTL